MKKFLFAALGALLFMSVGMSSNAITVERSSAPLAGVSGWSPVLIVTLDSGVRDVVGLSGVSYAIPIDAVIDSNVLMYERTAVAWVVANYGQPNVVIPANGGGGGMITIGVYEWPADGGGW